MKILIVIPIDPYRVLLSRCEISRPEYRVLTNGIITERPDAQRVVQILCDLANAKSILDFANGVYPEAAAYIEESIELARAA